MMVAGALMGLLGLLLSPTTASSTTHAHGGVDVKRCRVWGSGIHRRTNTPARYVHIAAVDHEGRDIMSSLGKGQFRVSVTHTDHSGKVSMLKVKELDRGDGTYSFQYYFSKPAKLLRVTVTTQETHSGVLQVAKSPYILDGPIAPETCICPRPIANFLQDFQCTYSDPAGQINRDMANFPSGVTREVFDGAITQLNRNESSLVHFTVKNNKIYSRSYGRYGDFQRFFNDILFSLQRKVLLPDVEFLLDMGDWPASPKKDTTTGAPLSPLPVFSWCGSDTHYDMVLPTYKLVQAGVFGKDLENPQEVDGSSYEIGGAWASKKPHVYFRGRPSNDARTAMFTQAKGNPILDIHITNNHFNYFPDDAARQEHREYEAKYGKKKNREPFSTAFKNKYQLNIDGTVAAYRLPALLAGNSVVLKQQSDYYEHFYKALQPWVHFVPLKRDLSDLGERMKWLKANDDEAEAIGRRGRLLAREHLRIEDVYCYHLLALEQFAALSLFDPVIADGMVEQIDKSAKNCRCPQLPPRTRPRTKVKTPLRKLEL